MEAVLSFLSNHYPTIGIVIAIAFIVYKATMYHVSIQNIKKKVAELPCDKHTKKLDELPVISKKVDDMRKILTEIGGALVNKK